MNIKLGQEAKDKVTGFQGIVMGECRYLTGCTQYNIQPPLNNGAWVENRWLDEGRLEVVGDGVAAEALHAEENGADIAPPSI